MKPADRLVADAFLDSLDGMRFTQPQPDHVVERRSRLANIVLTEFGDDDLESMTLRSLASAVLQLAIFADDLTAIEAFLAARRAHLEAFIACHPPPGV